MRCGIRDSWTLLGATAGSFMTPEALKLLEDMREAADDVSAFTTGKSVDDYRADKQLRRAVERSFEIIGEALSQLRKIEPQSAALFSESRKILPSETS
jgi:hypothetical protein